jgi:hypothetical protein
MEYTGGKAACCLSGLQPATPPSTTTYGDVIRRYQADDYPDDHRQPRPARAHELEVRFCPNLPPSWDKLPVDAVSNATCDRYCDYRVALIQAARADRAGTRLLDCCVETSGVRRWAGKPRSGPGSRNNEMLALRLDARPDEPGGLAADGKSLSRPESNFRQQ